MLRCRRSGGVRMTETLIMYGDEPTCSLSADAATLKDAPARPVDDPPRLGRRHERWHARAGPARGQRRSLACAAVLGDPVHISAIGPRTRTLPSSGTFAYSTACQAGAARRRGRRTQLVVEMFVFDDRGSEDVIEATAEGQLRADDTGAATDQPAPDQPSHSGQ
jgi:hypothetical protein